MHYPKQGNLLVLSFLLLSAIVITFFLIQTRMPPVTCQGEFDTAVVGAEIIDGLGGMPFWADVGIRTGRIACIGSVDRAKAGYLIDATGLTLTPGFIDVHTHVERNLSDTSPFLAPNFVRQGVTTIITGNCGRSVLDIRKLFRSLVYNGAEVNVATLIGHNTLRLQVMNQSSRPPSPAQLIEMNAIVTQAMRDGALGVSTGLDYIPGTFADTDELVELATAAGEFNGLYVSHIRDEGVQEEAAIREAVSIGERSGTPVHISHFKVQGPNQWGSSRHQLDLINSARDRGVHISLDQYPYTASSTGIAVLLPSWVSEGGFNAAKHRLTDPATRKRILNEMLIHLDSLGWKDYSFARVAYYKPDQSIVGLSIAEIADKRARVNFGKSAKVFAKTVFGSGSIRPIDSDSILQRQAEAILDIYAHGGAQMVFFDMAEDDIEMIMKAPEVMFGSDSGVREEQLNGLPHPRGLGTFPKILGHYVREKRLFTLEEAIRRMTSLPAKTFGLEDRGQIQEGYSADLVIFDRKQILDLATYEQPYNVPAGVRYVLVNGSMALSQGVLTGSLHGVPIRRGTSQDK